MCDNKSNNCEQTKEHFYINNFVAYVLQDNLYWYMGEHRINNPDPLPPGITFIYPTDTSVFDGVNYYPPLYPAPSSGIIPYFYKIANCVCQDVINNLKVGNQPIQLHRALRSPTYIPKINNIDLTTDVIFLSIYVTDKINKLCISQCIKEKIINTIINKLDLYLNSKFLNDYKIDNDKIYYIPNYVNTNTNTNTTITISPLDFLLFVKCTLLAYYSIDCCCENTCMDKTNIEFDDLCKIVFGNLYVVDVV